MPDGLEVSHMFKTNDNTTSKNFKKRPHRLVISHMPHGPSAKNLFFQKKIKNAGKIAYATRAHGFVFFLIFFIKSR